MLRRLCDRLERKELNAKIEAETRNRRELFTNKTTGTRNRNRGNMWLVYQNESDKHPLVLTDAAAKLLPYFQELKEKTGGRGHDVWGAVTRYDGTFIAPTGQHLQKWSDGFEGDDTEALKALGFAGTIDVFVYEGQPKRITVADSYDISVFLDSRQFPAWKQGASLIRITI